MKLLHIMESIILLAYTISVESYQQFSTKRVASSTIIFSKTIPDNERNQLISEGTNVLRGISKLVTFGLFSNLLISSKSASAKTFFDTDVYGDKELKIATVNKIKQKLRNAILQDISIAPHLFELALCDALGYDSVSGDGGQDGSILFEFPDDTDPNLKRASELILTIKKDLQRTNTVSYADLVAFGGGEALETVGCGRVTVQVGRFDAKAANGGTVILPWVSQSLTEVKATFDRSGLGPQQIALLLGALGEIYRVVDETNTAKATALKEDDEDEEEEQPFVPTTFGKRDAIYGAKMGKADFSSKYLQKILKKADVNDPIAKLLVGDAQVKAFVQKYAGSESAFLKDVPDAYLRLTLVGEAYTNRNS